MNCANCGAPLPPGKVWRHPISGLPDCAECPDEGWLRHVYGDAAAAELVALREGRPDAPTLEDIIATYPERRGRPRPDVCAKGHPFDVENTYTDRRGCRQCRICRKAYKAEQRAARRVAA